MAVLAWFVPEWTAGLPSTAAPKAECFFSRIVQVRAAEVVYSEFHEIPPAVIAPSVHGVNQS